MSEKEMRGFRVWHTKLNRYLKDEEFYIGSDGAVYSSFEVYDDEIIELDFIESFSRDDFDNGYIIREDDTGLKDKNGTKIYDGDIIDDGYSRICKIRWSEHFTAFEAVNENDGYVTNIWFVAKYDEVIGNIHDNPELLEER